MNPTTLVVGEGRQVKKIKDDSGFTACVESDAAGRILAQMLQDEFKDKIETVEVEPEATLT